MNTADANHGNTNQENAESVHDQQARVIDLTAHRAPTEQPAVNAARPADAADAAGPVEQGGPGTELEAKVFDADLVDDEAATDPAAGAGEDEPCGEQAGTDVVRVDQPAPPVPAGPGEVAHRPVIPQWARSRAEIGARAKFHARRTTHVAAFHAVRSPQYAARLAARAPRGAGRALVASARWTYDFEGHPLRRDAVAKGHTEEYLRLVKIRTERVRKRLAVAALAAFTGLVVTGLVVVFMPPIVGWFTVAAVIAALGAVGTQQDKPIASPAVVGTQVQKLTSTAVTDALGALGLSGINQAVAKGRGITFPSPITRDGPGWRADVDLPLGVTAGDVMDRRDKLASALRRPLGCVWPEGAREVHEGRLVIWIGDQDMSKAKQPPWPLGKSGRSDVFRPQPLGTDQRGRWVTITLMFTSGVIGAIPRMGKTVTLRELLLIGALDPRVQLHVYDLKGTGDLDPFEPVAHRYGVGDEPDDVDAMIASMRELRTELRRRAKVIRELPAELCPDKKVTPALASDTTLGLGPVLIGVDECQVSFEHPEHGAEFEEICTDLVKRGPAVGMMLYLATQRPDSKSIPTGISANASTRFCLKVMGQTENDMVLGTSQYKNGVRATTFSWGDKGIGYLVGEGSDAQIVRTVYQDLSGAKKIVARARVFREQAGTITGYAAGEAVDTEGARLDVLTDAASVFATGEDKLWSEVLLSRLVQLRPETYGQWNATALAAALKPHGVTPKQVPMRDESGAERNKRGYLLDALSDAILNRPR